MYNGAVWETFPQGSRWGKTNNYFVYGYTSNIIFLKKKSYKNGYTRKLVKLFSLCVEGNCPRLLHYTLLLRLTRFFGERHLNKNYTSFPCFCLMLLAPLVYIVEGINTGISYVDRNRRKETFTNSNFTKR